MCGNRVTRSCRRWLPTPKYAVPWGNLTVTVPRYNRPWLDRIEADVPEQVIATIKQDQCEHLQMSKPNRVAWR